MSVEANSNTLESRVATLDPTDPAALAALEQELMGGGEGNDEAAAVGADGVETVVVKDEPKQDENQQGAASGAQEKPKGVQAKDGDHIIPYSVLEREREARSRAEQMTQALTAEVERLKAGGKAEDAAAQPAASVLTEEDLAQLDQDLPGVSKVIRAQIAMIETLSGTVQSLRSNQEVVEQRQMMSVQDEITAAIEGHPDLKAWNNAASNKENPDPLMWNRAAEMDAVLRNDPAWQDKTIAERFAKVAETVKTLYGVPGVTLPTKQQPDLQQMADAKLKGQPAAVPTSLSDIPGGTPPSQSHIETYENASAVAIGQRFASMTPEQIESELSRLG